MNTLALQPVEPGEIRRLIDRAADTLAGAATAAEILDARDQAALAYSVAQAAGRLAKAKAAHDDVVARAYRAQADALEIESLAKRRLADEYDAAQERGEVAGHGGARGNQHGKVEAENLGEKPATAADAGLTRPQIFEARQIRDAIAAEPAIVRRVLDEILTQGDEPTKAKLKRALAPAITTLRKEKTETQKAKRTQKEIALAQKIEALPKRRYGVILADPEWRFEPYSRETGMDRAPDNHYPTSATADIAARDVASIAADDCALFLWATAPMLPDALSVMAAWGFEYRTHAVWVKQRTGDGLGPGYWFTGEHELLLVGIRGDVPAPALGTQWRSVIAAPVGEHSAKPEQSLDLIEAYFPNLPKIELNRRGPARDGWDAWGSEVDRVEDAKNRSGGSILGLQGLSATPREGATETETKNPCDDPLRDALIAAGLVPNSYILELNRGLTLEGPLDLPSRLLRFPIEFVDRKRIGAERSRLLLRHPLLPEVPAVAAFLAEIAAKTGIRPEWQAHDEFGRDLGQRWRWYHAVDLCNDRHWQDLLATRQFTEPEAIFGAVRIGLEGKSLKRKNARAIMTELGSTEPEDRSADLLVGNGLWPFRDGDKKYIAPNIAPTGEAGAWLTIHGMEDGWLAYVGQHLGVTAEGMARREKQKPADIQLDLIGDAAMEPASPMTDATASVEFVVGGMGKGGFAKFAVHANDDETFSISNEYDVKGLCGGSYPRAGRVETFGAAVLQGLAQLHERLSEVAFSSASACRRQHKACARGGLHWLDEQMENWLALEDQGEAQ